MFRSYYGKGRMKYDSIILSFYLIITLICIIFSILLDNIFSILTIFFTNITLAMYYQSKRKDVYI